MSTRRTLFAAIALAGLLPRVLFAQSAAGPIAPIQALDDALIAVMHAGKATPFAQRMAMLTPVVVKVFDLPTLLQSSVGPARWGVIPEPQKAELLDAFTLFTVSSYVGNFDSFNGEKFVIAPETRRVGNDMVVATRLMGNAGELAKLDYQMRESGGTWRVVDILLDGSISRVAVTRSDFRAVLAQGTSPGDASPLIAMLRSKSANLASGSPS
jgi:phospholipid transport system substrate-binding protein